MTNEELLLAMSDLLDVKLKAELQPLKIFRNKYNHRILPVQAILG